MDMTKGDVDMIDQMCNAFSIAYITWLWSVVVFFLQMNMAGIIYVSSLLFQCRNPKMVRGTFLRNMSMLPVMPYLIQRGKIKLLVVDMTTFLLLYEEPVEREGTCEEVVHMKFRRCVLWEGE